jgi:hypothetical protein
MSIKQFGFDLSTESWDADDSIVWDNVYTINQPHIPGGVSALGAIHDHAFVFEFETSELGTLSHVWHSRSQFNH